MGAAADSSEALIVDDRCFVRLDARDSTACWSRKIIWKLTTIHPAQTTCNLRPGDELVAFAQAHQMLASCWPQSLAW